MKRTFWLGLALCLAGTNAMAAAAACTSTVALPDMGPPGLATFSNSFKSAGSYTDCYTFSLDSPATSFGGAIEIDPLFNKLDIDIKDIALYAGDTRLTDLDANPLLFRFDGLLGAAVSPMFTLALSSAVTRDPGFWDRPVGYFGAIVTSAVKALPEPGPLALLAATAVGLFVARRRAFGRG